MPGYHIWTIGCQMNQADSDSLASSLEALGYEPVTMDSADLVVLNTCAVRQSAEDRAVGMLGSLKQLKRTRPQAMIALVGCLVDSNLADLRRRFPHVDAFCKPQDFGDLLSLAGERIDAGPAIPIIRIASSPTAFVPVIEGCNRACSYCIVPSRRGRERSHPLDEVLRHVRRLVERGVIEVTLLGQNVDSYGHDLPGKPDLADLMARVNAIEGLARIRFLTSHPRDMKPELIESIASLDKVCEHINLPVQSGDDAILRAMRRGYSVSEYREVIERIRAAMPGVALSTDVIVGYPGETDAQFQASVALLEEIKFDVVHVAAYSPRPGTAATLLDDHVPALVKKQRLNVIEELQKCVAGEINSRLVGQTVEVLVEGRNKGKWSGRTRTNKLTFFEDGADLTGRLVNVKIEKATAWSLQGNLAGAARELSGVGAGHDLDL